MTNNRWFEVYITDGLDKYYEKSTIPRIYIQTLKVRGEPLSTSEIDIYTLPHTSNEHSALWRHLAFFLINYLISRRLNMVIFKA